VGTKPAEGLTQKEATTARIERIRDAARWLVASAAAVGATLIAGSQLSDIGQLPVGAPTDLVHARLWVAVAGGALALGAVVTAIWAAVRLMIPLSATIADLDLAWDDGEKSRRDLRPAVEFFRANPTYLKGFGSPRELISRRELLVQRHRELRTKRPSDSEDEERERVESSIAELDRRSRDILLIAESRVAESRFASTSWQLLLCAVTAAVGITAFAWAGNPPEAPSVTTSLRGSDLSDAQLRDADLRGADLRGADLTGADLLGADLSGADVVEVTWNDTVCPDGTNSDDNEATCRGHLRP
jgi:hypothetical protein